MDPLAVMSAGGLTLPVTPEVVAIPESGGDPARIGHRESTKNQPKAKAIAHL